MDEEKLERVRQVEEACKGWRMREPGGEWMTIAEYCALERAKMEAAEAIKH